MALVENPEMAPLRFLDVPMELRDAIYSYVFKDTGILLSGKTSQADADGPRHYECRELYINWAMACKEIYYHAMAILWQCFKLEIEVERLYNERDYGLWNTFPLSKLSKMMKSVQNVVIIDSMSMMRIERLAAVTSFAVDIKKFESLRTITMRWVPNWSLPTTTVIHPRRLRPPALYYVSTPQFQSSTEQEKNHWWNESNHNDREQVLARREAFEEFLQLLQHHIQQHRTPRIGPDGRSEGEVSIKAELEHRATCWSASTPRFLARIVCTPKPTPCP